jgi:glycosyltransferase involved in cell wall biosynthesis
MDAEKITATTPLVSIIIPCYNHGQYIDDALQSVTAITDKNIYEVIIVNDGSTDEFTNRHLESLSDRYNVITQPNAGLSAARNTAIRNARGKYIMPLDADNKIREGYITHGVRIMESDPSISVVYGNAQHFGDENKLRKLHDFNLQKLMLSNFIDSCAIYRKSMWEDIGGYDTNMRDGFEDWEFWLNAAFHGHKFQYVDEILFDYRVLNTSMVHELNRQKVKVNRIIAYLVEKHPYFYGPQYLDENIMQKFSRNPIGFVGLLILKKWFPARFSKMVVKGRLRKYI